VQNSVASGKHTARRTVLAQCLAAGTAALLGLLHGPESALAALAGGLIVASGTALFAWRMFLKGVAPARTLLNSVIVAELLKWVWMVALLYAAIALWRLPALALILGMLAAHAGFYFALIKSR
jgi:F0F1-type ATP synthase assembly protein I